MQVAAVEPQRLHLGGLPHVTLLALPGSGVLGRVRSQPPHLAHAIGHLLGDEVGGPAVHRPVAGGIHDEVGGQLGAVLEDDRVLGEVVDLAVGELDLAVGDQIGGADVDVIARPAPQVLHEQP